MGELVMITKTFICDLCKKSVGEFELFQLSTNLTIPKSNGYLLSLATVKKDICKCCLKAKGIVIEETEDRKIAVEIEQKNQKTFESKILDLLEDLGVAFVE
jgi:hypothetical protein